MAEGIVKHFCNGRWVTGPVVACSHHRRLGRAPNLIPFDERNRVIIEGVASTGKVSPKGTVAHREWFDGHVDAKASPRPVTMKLSELRKAADERR